MELRFNNYKVINGHYLDQNAPLLKISKIFTDLCEQNNSHETFWKKIDIKTLIYVSTESGEMIVSGINKEERIVPLSLICVHSTPVITFTKSNTLLNLSSIITLSKDGSIGIISRQDFSVLYFLKECFPKECIQLEPHPTEPECFFAIIDDQIILKNIISNTNILSIKIPNIFQINSFLGNFCVFSGTSYSVFTFNQEVPACLVHSSCGLQNEYKVILSPSLTFALYTSKNFIRITDGSSSVKIPFESEIKDSKWINSRSFWVITKESEIFIYETNLSSANILCSLPSLKVEFNAVINDIPTIISSPDPDPSFLYSKLKTNIEIKLISKEILENINVFDVTSDYHVVSSNEINKIYMNGVSYDLCSAFSGRKLHRTAVMSSPPTQASIDTNGNVVHNNIIIGEHKTASLIFAPPIGATFFTCGTDGSIAGWADRRVVMVRVLTSEIKFAKWIEKTVSVAFVTERSFLIIELGSCLVTAMCLGTPSPISDVTFSNGFYYAILIDGKVTTWTKNGVLVSTLAAAPPVIPPTPNPSFVRIVMPGFETTGFVINLLEDTNLRAFSDMPPMIAGYETAVTLPLIKRPMMSISPIQTAIQMMIRSMTVQDFDDDYIKPSFAVLGEALKTKLRLTAMHIIQELLSEYTEEESKEAVMEAAGAHRDPSVVIPILLVHCCKYQPINSLLNNYSDYILPLLHQIDIADLFARAARHIFPSLSADFLQKIIESDLPIDICTHIGLSVSDDYVCALAISPRRKALLSPFIKAFKKYPRDEIIVAFSKLIMMDKVSDTVSEFVSSFIFITMTHSHYIVGHSDGMVIGLPRGKSKLFATKSKDESAISLVTLSPHERNILAISAAGTAIWIREKDRFVYKNVPIALKSNPAYISWQSDDIVEFQDENHITIAKCICPK